MYVAVLPMNAQTLTLEDCKQLAHDNYPTVKQYHLVEVFGWFHYWKMLLKVGYHKLGIGQRIAYECVDLTDCDEAGRDMKLVGCRLGDD